MKSTLVRKKIGDKVYKEITQERKIKIITDSTYTKSSTIDEFYDEVVIERGACVELEFVENTWYILSSDGLKLN